jgi:predicted unusual protein kinase regulating ubiquinone biosynthesis (AarF/ABC1/UbiB family)
LKDDGEGNRFSARASRYARLGANAGGFAVRVAANRLTGGDSGANARSLTSALGSLKGPLIKVAQLLATIPEALPPGYAEELMTLQTQATADGRRLRTPAYAGRTRR